MGEICHRKTKRTPWKFDPSFRQFLAVEFQKGFVFAFRNFWNCWIILSHTSEGLPTAFANLGVGILIWPKTFEKNTPKRFSLGKQCTYYRQLVWLKHLCEKNDSHKSIWIQKLEHLGSTTRWAPTSYKWTYDPYKWSCITLLIVQKMRSSPSVCKRPPRWTFWRNSLHPEWSGHFGLLLT